MILWQLWHQQIWLFLPFKVQKIYILNWWMNFKDLIVNFASVMKKQCKDYMINDYSPAGNNCYFAWSLALSVLFNLFPHSRPCALIPPCALEHCGKRKKKHDSAAEEKKNTSILKWYFLASQSSFFPPLFHFLHLNFLAELQAFVSSLGTLNTQKSERHISNSCGVQIKKKKPHPCQCYITVIHDHLGSGRIVILSLSAGDSHGQWHYVFGLSVHKYVFGWILTWCH